VSIKAVIVTVAAGAAIAGSVALTSQVADPDRAACRAGAHAQSADPAAAHDHAEEHERHSAGHVMLGPTCNTVEMVGPEDSTYRPDVAAATPTDRARARKLLRGVNEFCRTHSAQEIMAEWTPGDTNPSEPTHYFNPDGRGSLGLDPTNPRAVLIYQERIGGVMLTGVPLPSLGSIPRAHSHDMSRPREMVHVYCTTDLAEAFTPDRRLGVMADVIALRGEVRPLVSGLLQPQLGEALRFAREHAGDELQRVDPREAPPTTLADPRLWAKREELRRSLMLLGEPRLRRLLRMVART
jgi:hypothetical protein